MLEFLGAAWLINKLIGVAIVGGMVVIGYYSEKGK